MLLVLALLSAFAALAQGHELLGVPALLGTWGPALYDLLLAERKAGRFPRTALSPLLFSILFRPLCNGSTSYDFNAPDGVHPMDGAASVQGGQAPGPHPGARRQHEGASPLIYLVSRFAPEVSLRPANTPEGCEEARESMLATSSSLAYLIAAALAPQYLGLGKGVVSTGKGAIVSWVKPGSAAAGQVEIGDLIIAADGRPVSGADPFRTALMPLASGTNVKLSRIREKQAAEVTLTLAPRPGAPGRGYAGVTPEDDLAADIPLQVPAVRSIVAGSSWGGAPGA